MTTEDREQSGDLLVQTDAPEADLQWKQVMALFRKRRAEVKKRKGQSQQAQEAVEAVMQSQEQTAEATEPEVDAEVDLTLDPVLDSAYPEMTLEEAEKIDTTEIEHLSDEELIALVAAETERRLAAEPVPEGAKTTIGSSDPDTFRTLFEAQKKYAANLAKKAAEKAAQAKADDDDY